MARTVRLGMLFNSIVQGKVDSSGQVQMHKSRAKGRDKGVATCQGNRAMIKKKASIRTTAKKQQARPIS